MIIGVGIDTVDLNAFETQLQDHASSFVAQTFTPQERYTAQARPGQRPARHLAARFAAKEAFLKAFSSAYWGQPDPLKHVDMREIEVLCDPYHRPRLHLHGAIQEAIADLAPWRAHLSMTHDGDVANAFVILERAQQNTHHDTNP